MCHRVRSYGCILRMGGMVVVFRKPNCQRGLEARRREGVYVIFGWKKAQAGIFSECVSIKNCS